MPGSFDENEVGVWMLFALGIALVGLTIGMVLLGRPADGVAAPFLRAWLVGQAYILGAMVSALAGIVFIITEWPF